MESIDKLRQIGDKFGCEEEIDDWLRTYVKCVSSGANSDRKEVVQTENLYQLQKDAEASALEGLKERVAESATITTGSDEPLTASIHVIRPEFEVLFGKKS